MDYETIYKRSIELAKYFVECGHLSQSDAEEMFPELAESEDERMIDFLIEYFSVKVWKASYPFSPIEIRNWLEKQREQKRAENNVIIPKFHTGDYIKSKAYNEEHLIKDINKNGYVLDIDMIIPFKDEDVWELSKQKSVEWSEEDERICNGLKELIPQCMTAQGYNRYYNWLKNLHNRIHPQPHWKPSEGQIVALNCAIQTMRRQLNLGDKRLLSLYNDLKKLM